MKRSSKLLLVSLFTLIILSSLYYTNSMFARGDEHDDDDDDDDDDDFSDKDIIEICCTWGYELADGVLTYAIDSDDDDDDLMDSVRSAVATWNSELTGIRLVETEDNSNEDIKISFENDGERIAGKTVNYFDRFGFIRQSEIIVSEESYDRDFSSSHIEQITLHELGHVLGLDHANFRGNLMAERVDLGTNTLSSCEIQAVNIANSWKLNGGNTMYLPEEQYIEC